MNKYRWFRNHEEEQQNEKTSADRYEELWIENFNLKNQIKELVKEIAETDAELARYKEQLKNQVRKLEKQIKKEAITFAEWFNDNDYNRNKKYGWHKSSVESVKDWLTTEQLYEIFQNKL